jgi:hypothetical protein
MNLRRTVVAGVASLAAWLAAALSAQAADWRALGLLRVRDMTPFGINRLDMLPAHAVASTPGVFAFELNTTYQNTWALSGNVEEYLASRGPGRRPLTTEDVAAILALPGDAYLVDGEFGLVDLTLHYRVNRHLGLYATVPYYFFDGGFLDSTIESFHENFGFSTAARDLAERNQWQVVAKLDQRVILVAGEAPANDLGDPVVGLRWAFLEAPDRYNVVLETAAKIAWADEERLVSTGEHEWGTQLSLQRFFRRNALYLSLAAVYYRSPDPRLAADQWLPTVVAGWETRLTRHTNFILQFYASRSTVQNTPLEELSADKLQATVGIQWLYRGNVLRFGITENLANFHNTPDVGVTFSVARIFGRTLAVGPAD